METLDLLQALPRAERRGLASGRPPAEVTLGGADLRPAIGVVVPSRITWRGLRFPERSVVRASIAARPGAGQARLLFRIGVSDDRSYDELLRETIDTGEAGWTDVRVDLSRYAGWQWSVFYHPDRRCWNLVFNVSAASGPAAGAEGLWARPAVFTDADAFSAFRRRSGDRPCG